MNMKRFLLLSLLFGLLPGLASAAWTHGPGVRTPHTLLDALSADEAPGRTVRASLQPRTDTGDSLLLVGSVISTGNTSIHPMGLYSFTEGGTFTTLFKGLRSTGGGTLARDLFHSVMYTSPVPGVFSTTWMKISPATWKRTGGANLSIADIAATDMAYDPTTDNVYGCYYNTAGTGYVFGYADFELARRTVIRELEQPWFGVMCTASGQVYAIDAAGDLLRVDKATGATTRVGATGLAPYYMTSGTIDPVTGRCFFTVSTSSHSSALCEINLQTGLATKIFDFPYNEEVTALSVIRDAATPAAPAPASALKATFADGSLSGTVSFAVPATLSDGTIASGPVTYRLVVDGRVYAEAQTTYGSSVEVPVTAPATGKTRFTVLLANDAGLSVPARTWLFTGNGTPRVPAPALTYEDGVCKVTWKAVTTTLDGGFFSTAELYYRVTRLSDGKVLADSVRGLEYADTLGVSDRLSKHQYAVQAHFRGNFSNPGKTTAVVSGSIVEPPFSDNFDNKAFNAHYTVIDANGDGKSWIQRSSTTGGFGCSGMADMAMDDWFITPPVRLRAGHIYRLRVVAGAGYASRSPERFEVKWGKEPTVAAMTSTLIPATDLTVSEDRTYTAWMRPDADGLYHVGVHGISDPGSFRLDVNDIAIDGAVSVQAPAEPTAFAVTPDADGNPAATFTFNAPEKAIDGSALTAISSVTVESEGRTVATFADGRPGARLTFSDSADKPGVRSYTITASNAFGAGQPLETSAFLGINTPADVSDLSFTESASNPGTVTLSWTAPTVDRDGNAMNPDLVTYTVAQLKTSGDVVVAEGLKQCTYTYQAVAPGADQEFLAYAVYAVSKGGRSPGKGTGTLSVGTPYANPYRESCTGGTIAHNLGINRFVGSGAQWLVAGATTFTDTHAADGDDGFLVYKGVNQLDSARIYTGKIALDATSPSAVTFFTYNIADQDRDINTLTVEVNDGTGWKAVRSGTVDALCGGRAGWQRVEVDLDAYRGKTVQVAFTACIHLYAFVFVDAVRVGTIADRNLALQTLEVPAESRPGQPVACKATVGNEGRTPADSYTVKLLRGDKVVAVAQSDTTLLPGLKQVYELADTLTVLDDERVTYRAEVEWSGDQLVRDNVSAPAVTMLSLPVWPAPQALTGAESGSSVRLDWQAPDLEGGAAAVTDTFESYTAYANSALGDWTLVDGDQGQIGAIQNTAIPGIDQGSRQSWFVLTSQLRPDSRFFAAHSGNQYLSNMYVYRDGQAVPCDDWLISPRLSGKEQTISFWAKSYNAKYPETFRLMVSSADKNTASFTELASRSEISDEWTEFTFTLPAGTQYFAIRCVSFDRMMMFVDDVTYQPASGEGLQLLGYNVYRDGARVNTEAVTAPTYLDRKMRQGSYRYRVSALYTLGESRPTAEISVTHTSVESLDDDTAEVVAESWYTIDGLKVARPAARDGQLYVVMRRYADGSARTFRIRN